jgi:hypothetical protein
MWEENSLQILDYYAEKLLANRKCRRYVSDRAWLKFGGLE